MQAIVVASRGDRFAAAPAQTGCTARAATTASTAGEDGADSDELYDVLAVETAL